MQFTYLSQLARFLLLLYLKVTVEVAYCFLLFPVYSSWMYIITRLLLRGSFQQKQAEASACEHANESLT